MTGGDKLVLLLAVRFGTKPLKEEDTLDFVEDEGAVFLRAASIPVKTVLAAAAAAMGKRVSIPVVWVLEAPFYAAWNSLRHMKVEKRCSTDLAHGEVGLLDLFHLAF